MKEEWPRVALSELTAQRPICYGVLKPGERQKRGVPLVRITDIATNALDESDIYLITPELSAEFRRSVLEGGEVLLSIQGTIGRAALCPPHLKGANISRTLALIAPDERLDRAFLRYWLLSLDGEFQTGGSTRASLNIGTIRELKAPVPPLPEQRRIVGVLDDAFASIKTARENAERNLRNARALFESHLDATFAQDRSQAATRQLADLCDPSRAISYGVIKLGAEVAGGVPCLRSSNVRRLRIDTTGLRQIDPSLSQAYARTVIRGDEVLVNVRGTLGGVAVAGQEYIGWNISREVAIVPVDPTSVNPQYCAYWIASNASQRWLSGVKTGSTYIGINLADLRLLPVEVPSLERQSQIVLRLDQARRECLLFESACSRKLDALDELKQSLLQRAFAGEL